MLDAWIAAAEVGFELWAGDEPLGRPLDLYLARRVIAGETLTEATHRDGEQIDLMLKMAGFDFETVWRERRIFRLGDLEIPVARLLQVVESKAAADRP